jgi:hypothetical protein
MRMDRGSPHGLNDQPEPADDTQGSLVVQARYRGRRRLAIANLALALVLLVAAVLVDQVAPNRTRKAVSQSSAVSVTPTIDPRLILRPRTLTQAVVIEGVRITVEASPLIPGANHLVVTLTEQGQAIDGARVSASAVMAEMVMRPVRFVTSAKGGGRYEATGPLPMFGLWRLTIEADRPHEPHLSHTFALGLDIPAALLNSLGAATPPGPPSLGTAAPSPTPTSVAVPPNTGHPTEVGSVTVELSQPSNAPDVLSVRQRAGLRVRYLMDMPAMPGMGASPFDAQPAGGDTYSGMVIFPMAGRTRIVVQVLAQGKWQAVLVALYNVDAKRIAHPIPTDAPFGRLR